MKTTSSDIHKTACKTFKPDLPGLPQAYEGLDYSYIVEVVSSDLPQDHVLDLLVKPFPQ